MQEEGHSEVHVKLDSGHVPDEATSMVGSRLSTSRTSRKRRRADFGSSTGFSGPCICEECDLEIDILELKYIGEVLPPNAVIKNTSNPPVDA